MIEQNYSTLTPLTPEIAGSLQDLGEKSMGNKSLAEPALLMIASMSLESLHVKKKD